MSRRKNGILAGACVAVLAVPAIGGAQGGKIRATPDRDGEANRGAERLAENRALRT